MASNSTPPSGAAPQPIDLAQSVAGEEDPGASLDMAVPAGASDQPGGGMRQPVSPQAPMSPGDQAPAGTPGTGETVCPACGGTGQVGAKVCPHCEGTGRVTVGIGGA